ncbi:hypothetical protein SAMN05660826_00543 [Caldanaerovirga acetigignens]|uniref:Uncharacterized protein n=1 Tax=Caldanaerovirga acetigignens TaxID=447595 RepID=A0A1M7H9C9_9FIRM|nr:hypothetical protein [Caldanaerovirga acetigignens]SHM25134.1 hypothetical protein SAMN05660826_00543 [Caldanaerovirga acetigignens]
MRWNNLIASVSLFILLYIKIVQGKIWMSIVLGFLGIFYLFRFFKSIVINKKNYNYKRQVSQKKPGKEKLLEYIKLNEKLAKNWLILSVSAGVFGIVGFSILKYPPFSLLMIIIGLYCTIRYRKIVNIIKKGKFALNINKE